MNARKPARRRGEAGLTLIELMVAILLAGILSTGLFYMTAGQSRTYGSQLKSLSIQENLWSAMEYLQRQIRMAGFGFGGCPGTVKKWSGAGSTTVDSGIRGLVVYNNCSWYSSNCPGGATGDGVDSFGVSYSTNMAAGNEPSVRVTSSMPRSSAELKVATCGNFADNDLAVLWDPANPTGDCLLVQITHVAPSGSAQDCKLQHHPLDPYNPSGGDTILPPGGMSAGTMVIRWGSSEQPLKFAIDKDDADPTHVPRLVQWLDPSKSDLQVIAENIEDMQISYGCDLDANGVTEGNDATTKQSDEWAYNVASDTVPACGTNPVLAVRITLTARSSGPEAGSLTGSRPAAEDRVASAADRYTRATLTSIVRPRNLAR